MPKQKGGKKGAVTSEPYHTKKNTEKQSAKGQDDENLEHTNEDVQNHEDQANFQVAQVIRR